jgi:U1 small nuclear ribonucleoprotein
VLAFISLVIPSHCRFCFKRNAYCTLFVGRLSYETTEKKLRREFEQFGAVRNIRLVLDKDGKSRGYAFVEFSSEQDLQMAYRKSEGRKIDGRRIIVDVERGRYYYSRIF